MLTQVFGSQASRRKPFFYEIGTRSLLIAGVLVPTGVLRADEIVANGSDEVVVVARVAEGGDEGEGAEKKSNRLWLGVILKNIEGDLATYLGTDKGVLVDQVQEGSPADKAGLRKGDILLKIGQVELVGPADVLKLLADLKSSDGDVQPLQITVQRKAEELELEVVPAPRPKEMDISVNVGLDNISDLSSLLEGSDAKDIKALLGKIEVMPGGEGINVFRFGNPAMVWVPEAENDFEIQLKKVGEDGDMEVTVKRSGKEAPEITVKEGDSVKVYHGDQLDEVPEDVRRWIEPVLKQQGKKRLNLSTGGSGSFFLQADEAKSAEEIKAMVEELKAKTRKSAETAIVQAQEAAKQAQAQAEEAVKDVQERMRKAAQLPNEVDELRKLVEQLRAEVKVLRESQENR